MADGVLVVSQAVAPVSISDFARHHANVVLGVGRAGAVSERGGSQSVNALAAQVHGYDAAKKTAGLKWHIAVDTNGRPLMVNLTPADIADSTGAMAARGILMRVADYLRLNRKRLSTILAGRT